MKTAIRKNPTRRNILPPFQFQHVVGGVYEVLGVLDGNNGVARLGKPTNQVQQMADVVLVQPTRRLVKKEQRAQRLRTGKGNREPKPCPFPT